jgi:hypothetical protein
VAETKDYAFVPGGIIWKIIDRTGFEQKSIRFKIVMVVILALVCWLPIALLSFVQLGWHQFSLLFIRDIATQAKFLFVFPILLFARHSVNKSLAKTIYTFYESKIIDKDNHEKFQSKIDWLIRWRNSLLVDILLVILVYSVLYVRETTLSDVADFSTPWLAFKDKISAAGWWYIIFSLPVFQLVLYRWLYSTITWIIFLWKISKIDLKLSSLHPDGMGGLGFLKYTQLSFFPVALALSSIVAAGLNNLMIFSDASIYDFPVLIISLLVFVFLLFVLPLFVFIPLLASVKRKYFLKYSKDAWDFARAYEKELDEYYATGENRPDTSWHVDLIGSFEQTANMKVVPMDKVILIAFVSAVIFPFIPVVAQEIPLKDLIGTLISKFLG